MTRSNKSKEARLRKLATLPGVGLTPPADVPDSVDMKSRGMCPHGTSLLQRCLTCTPRQPPSWFPAEALKKPLDIQ